MALDSEVVRLASVSGAHKKYHLVVLDKYMRGMCLFMFTCLMDKGPEKSLYNQIIKKETKTSILLNKCPGQAKFESCSLYEGQAQIQI